MVWAAAPLSSRVHRGPDEWCSQPHHPCHYGTRVSITEEAVAPVRRAGAWWWLVAACALVLLLITAGLAVWYFASRETRTTTYDVLGDLSGVKLDLGSSDVELDGGAS